MSGGGVSAPGINFMPTSFNSPGLAGTFFGTQSGGSGGGGMFGGGSFNVSRNPGMAKAMTGLSQAFTNESAAFDALLQTVKPGFSQFRQAGLADIETQRQANVSNLSDTMAQRRVLGSSFANSSISQANAQYDQMRSDFIAKSYLSELAASNQLTQEKFGALTQGFSAQVNQMDFEAGLAAQMSSSVTQAYAQLAQAEAQMKLQASEFNAQMQMQEMMGFGQLLGGFMGMGGGGGMSDVRLKENIHQVGFTKHGLPLYTYNYIGDDDLYEGVMAHDVLKVMPSAVSFGITGYRVNYEKLGITLKHVGTL